MLTTAVIGSYPQPDWLIDRAALGAGFVPRVRVREAWRVGEPFLHEAQDDATRLAIRDMELAGIDVITDGEIRRESYSNRFATALEGVDADNPATITTRAGAERTVPRIIGPVRWCGPVEVRDLEFLRDHTDRIVKITLPGPFTMAQQAANEHYDDPDELVIDLAAAVNREARALQEAGAGVIQLDEPWLRNDPEAARRTAVAAIDRALDGHRGHDRGAPVLRLCGAGRPQAAQPLRLPRRAQRQLRRSDLDRGRPAAARPRSAVRAGPKDDPARGARPRRSRGRAPRARWPSGSAPALAHVPARRLVPAPDCGMKYLPRERAFGKLRALSAGAAIVGAEL